MSLQKKTKKKLSHNFNKQSAMTEGIEIIAAYVMFVSNHFSKQLVNYFFTTSQYNLQLTHGLS